MNAYGWAADVRYRGFVVHHLNALGCGRPWLRVVDGIIGVTVGAQVRFYRDIDEIEAWLVKQAAEPGFGGALSRGKATLTKEQRMSVDSASSPWQWATSGVQKDFASAYAGFRGGLQAAWPSSETERTIGAAFMNHLATLQDSWSSPDFARRAAESYATYTGTVQRAFAPDSSRRQIQEAFQSYVADHKRAWQQMDAALVKPEDLLTIAQSMAWVAGVAAQINSPGS